MTYDVEIRLDRLQIAAWTPRGSKPPLLDGYRIASDWFVRRQTTTSTYARCRRLKSLATGAELFWQYGRQKGWLSPFKITMVADDRKGLRYDEIKAILKHCRGYRFLTVEIAVDFAPSARITSSFVSMFGLFGKSRLCLNSKHSTIHYGTRKASKYVRAYWKDNLGVFRVEVELHGRLLGDIVSLNEFRLLPCLIYPKHLCFVTPDWDRLKRVIAERFGSQADRVIAGAKWRAESLHALRSYLRGNGVVNVHRFFVPLPINAEIRRALARWARPFIRGAQQCTS